MIATHVDQQRAEGMIGASDAACALGLDRWRSPITLWRQLRGLPVDDSRPKHVAEAAVWGQILEPVIRGRYATIKGAIVLVPRVSEVLDGWLRATPDGYVMPAFRPSTEPDVVKTAHTFRDSGASCLVQIKTASAYLRDDWADGAIPAKYEIQMRTEMAVTGAPSCDVVCLLGGQQLVGPVTVTRDLAIEDRILTGLRAFRDSVTRGIEPAPDASEAWRAHVAERMRPTKVEIQASGPVLDAAMDWLARRNDRKRAADAEEAARARVMRALADAGATAIKLDDKRKISAYQTGARTDWQAYALALGGAAEPPEQYRRPATTWALRAPRGEDHE